MSDPSSASTFTARPRRDAADRPGQRRQQDLGERRRGDPQSGVHLTAHTAAADQDQSFALVGVLVRELGGDPASERMADDRGVFDLEDVEQIPHAVGVCRDRVVGAGLVGLAVTKQVRRDDREALRELRHERHPARRVVTDAVQEEEHRPRAPIFR